MDTEAKEVNGPQVSYIFYLLQYLSAPQRLLRLHVPGGQFNAAIVSRTATDRGVIGSIDLAVKLAFMVTEGLKHYAG